MDTHLRALHTIVLIALGAMCMPLGDMSAHAQEPASINNLVTATSEYTAEQRAAIAAYAMYWSKTLLSDNPEQARLAKRRLTDPFRAPGIRRIFRDAYGRAAISELSPIIDSDNTFASVNAIQVVAEFATEGALSVMRDRCDSEREQRWQVRLWAAHGIARIVSRVTADEDIPGRTIDAAVRDLTRAGRRETHWLVLQRQFEALAAAQSQQSREAQISLLDATLDRMSDDANGPSDMMQPVYRALVLLRDQYLDPNLSSAARRELGTAFAPLLGRIFEIGMMHWDSAKVDRDVKASYDGAISLAENLLSLVDTQVRGNQPPRTAITAAWDSNNRTNFEADVRRWRAVLEAPPYAQR